MVVITIPFKTPSVNHLYFNFRNIRILTKEARTLKKEIEEIVKNEKILFNNFDNQFKVKIEIYEDWFFKNGEVKRTDIANREKFLVDAIFDALGIDDKYIFENTMIKIQSDTEEKAVITIEEL